MIIVSNVLLAPSLSANSRVLAIGHDSETAGAGSKNAAQTFA
ncbi:hypothetical protein CF149_23311 [Pseudomonas psychrophila]|nr:hypothetical protein CF149_23311 [Pseudomonas psychrophila]